MRTLRGSQGCMEHLQPHTAGQARIRGLLSCTAWRSSHYNCLLTPQQPEAAQTPGYTSCLTMSTKTVHSVRHCYECLEPTELQLSGPGLAIGQRRLIANNASVLQPARITSMAEPRNGHSTPQKGYKDICNHVSPSRLKRSVEQPPPDQQQDLFRLLMA